MVISQLPANLINTIGTVRGSFSLIFMIAATALAAGPVTPTVYRSTDRGRTWSRSDLGLAGNPRVNAFAQTGGTTLAGTDAGIFLSYDQGRHWLRATSAGKITSLATNSDRSYAGTDRQGLLSSSDVGKTWSVVPNFPARNIRSLLAHEGKIYAGTDADGILMSTNQGQTWTPTNSGLPPSSQIFTLSVAHGRIFAGLYAKGLWVWNDLRQGWTRQGTLTPLVLTSVTDTLIAGLNPGGLYASDNAGQDWRRATGSEPAPGAPVWAAASAGGLTFAGAANGIYFSEDQARTWHRSITGLEPDTPGIAFHIQPGFVLAATLIKTP